MSNVDLESLLVQCLATADPRAAVAEVAGADAGLKDKLSGLLARLETKGLLEPAVDSTPHTERRIAGYRLLEKIGEGGMGVVYLAEEEALGRQVALKVVRPELVHFETSRRRLENEVAAIARTNHPGIVQILGAGEADGQHYFAMELVGGRTLAQILASLKDRDPSTLSGRDLFSAGSGTATGTRGAELGRASWVDACLMCVRDVAEALIHAHENGVLHRDIKPSNIMFDAVGRVRVVDFGLAQLDDSQRMTKSGSLLGSLPYMAPEQVRGERQWIDDRADVYGLGVTLFELLTLQNPFLHASAETTRRRILNGDHVSLRSLNRRVAGDVHVVCTKAMAKEREHRFASMAEFCADLDNLLAHRTIAARAPSPSLRLRRWMQRHPAVSLAAAAVLVLTTVGAVLLAVQQARASERESELRSDAVAAKDEADKQRRAAESAVYRASLVAGSALLDRGETARAIENLALSKPGLRHWEWRHLAKMADSSVAVLRPTGPANAPVRGLDVSPSQGLLACVENSGGLHVYRLPSLELVRRWQLHSDTIADVKFIDDQRLVVGGAEGLAAIVDLTGSVTRLAVGGGNLQAVAVSPAKRWVACVDASAQLQVFDLAANNRKREWTVGRRALTGVAFGLDDRFVVVLSADGQLWRRDLSLPDSVATESLTDRNAGAAKRPHRGVAVGLVRDADGGRVMVNATSFKSVWDVARGRLAYYDPKKRNYTVHWLRGKTAIVARRQDAMVSVMQLPDRPVLQHQGSGHRASIFRMAYAKKHRLLFSASQDGTVRVWREKLLGAVWRLSEWGRSAFRSVAYDRDGGRVVGLTTKGDLMFWNAATGEPIRHGKFEGVSATHLTVDRATNRILAGGKGGLVFASFDDPAIRLIKLPKRLVLGLHWLGEDRLVSIGNRSILVMDAAGKTVRQTELESGFDPYALAVHARGDRLAVGAVDGRVAEWSLNAETGQLAPLGEIGRFERPVVALSYLPGPQLRLVGCAYDLAVVLWTRSTTGVERKDIGRLASMPGAMVTHPTEPRLFLGDASGNLEVWDTNTWRHVITTRNSAGAILALALAPDGEQLAMGSMAKCVLLVNTATQLPKEQRKN